MHVESGDEGLSDAGSTPAASTNAKHSNRFPDCRKPRLNHTATASRLLRHLEETTPPTPLK